MKRREFLATSAALAAGANLCPYKLRALEAQEKAAGRPALGSAKEGLVDVGIARGSNMEDAVRKAVELSGGIDFIQEGQTGAIKNPTTTSPEVLYAVIKLVNERGPRKILVSDRSFSPLFTLDPERALTSPTTMSVMKEVGHFDAVEQAKSELKAPVVAVGLEEAASQFEDLGKPADTNAWRKIKPEGAGHWPNGFELAELLFSVDHVINVPVIKTHFQAWFTMSMKAFVGMSHHRTRKEFHDSRHVYQGDRSLMDQTGNANRRSRRRGVKIDPEEESNKIYPFVARIAELNLGLKPSLNILDGTSSFVFGGPSHGDSVDPKIVVASRDRIAADTTGVAVLKRYGCEERLMSRSPWELPFVRHAMKIGLGIDSPGKLNLKYHDVADIDQIKEMLA
jgi:uncharacterized protein (DUF362 family)